MNLYTDLIAMDIGTSCVKLAVIDPGPSKQGYRVKQLLKKDIPEGLVGGDFTHPHVSDVEALKKIIAGLTKKIKNSKQGLVIGLPDRWVKLHLLNMKLSETEKKSPEFLSWRIEKNLPVPENMEVVVDFQILGPDMDSEEPDTYRIMAAAVKKDIIDVLSSLTTKLELEVMAFDTSSLGVFNLFEEAFPDKCVDQTVINLHIGHETTVVKAYSKGTLIYERVIESAGDEFTQTIAMLDSLNHENAAKRKEKEKFFPSTRSEVVELIGKRERIDKIFGNWLREINVTFRFFQEKYGLSHLPSIFITGGGAQISGLDAFLSEFCTTRCMVFNPLNEIPLAGKLKKDLIDSGPEFAPCIGLLAK
ncbi:MAG: pilus assembly protein PilM [Candidatus Rifleibacteriota bacterium]